MKTNGPCTQPTRNACRAAATAARPISAPAVVTAVCASRSTGAVTVLGACSIPIRFDPSLTFHPGGGLLPPAAQQRLGGPETIGAGFSTLVLFPSGRTWPPRFHGPSGDRATYETVHS